MIYLVKAKNFMLSLASLFLDLTDMLCVGRYEKSGNEQFITELSKWIFHERGHLKVILFFLAM